MIGWTLVGLAAGFVHIGLLWRRVHRRGRGAWLRLPLVVGGLIVAARAGGIFPAAVGWALGFGLGAIALRERSAR